jgi:hypothetical protein
MKILYVSTFFHEYHNRIIDHLEKIRGAKVDRFVLEKKRLSLSLLRLLSISAYKRARRKEYLRLLSFSESYDIIFIQSPYFIPIDILLLLKEKAEGARLISYSWDSIKSCHEVEYFVFFDKFYSFDPYDCEKFEQLQYLPLFYTSDFFSTTSKRKVSLAFVGGIGDSSDRYSFIKSVRNQCEQNNLSNYIYPRIPLIYFIKGIFSGTYYSGVKFRSLRLKEISEIYRNANCVVDQNNPLQKGMTMRTFEALASGCKLITTNASIVNESIFDKRYISIIDRKNPVIDVEFIKQEHPMDFDYINTLSEYNMSRWISNVFDE